MTDPVGWAAWSAALAFGAATGAAYFGALWLVAARMSRSRRPARWLLASLPLRLGAAAAAFYVVLMLGDWTALVAALIGFVAIRQIAVARARRGIGGTD